MLLLTTFKILILFRPKSFFIFYSDHLIVHLKPTQVFFDENNIYCPFHWCFHTHKEIDSTYMDNINKELQKDAQIPAIIITSNDNNKFHRFILYRVKVLCLHTGNCTFVRRFAGERPTTSSDCLFSNTN